MKLHHNLCDIDGNVIAEAGWEINRGLIKEAIRREKAVRRATTLLNRRSFLQDLDRVINEEVYRSMFGPLSHRKALLGLIKKVRMPSALFREILSLKRTSYYTYRHFILIGCLSAKMSQDLRAYGYDAREAFKVGLTHDIGKTRLARSILNKRTPLTSNEYRILHSYPTISHILLRYYLGEEGAEACRVAYDHHEKLDGTGYPRGIKTMSKYTKLVAIVDIFDALVADRPYRKRGFTVRGAVDKLLAEMKEGKLPQHPIRLLICYLRRDKPNFKTIRLSEKARDPDPEGNMYGKVVQ